MQSLLTPSKPTCAEYKVSNGGCVPKPVPFNMTATQSADLHCEVLFWVFSKARIDAFWNWFSWGASGWNFTTGAACWQQVPRLTTSVAVSNDESEAGVLTEIELCDIHRDHWQDVLPKRAAADSCVNESRLEPCNGTKVTMDPVEGRPCQNCVVLLYQTRETL